MQTADTCAHVACRCTKPYDKKNQAGGVRYVDPNAEHCSDRCATQASQPRQDSGGCECGHPACAPQQTPDLPPI